MHSSSKIEIKEESLSLIISDIQDLLEDHYQEVAIDKSLMRLDPDYDTYRLLDDAGRLTIVTVRDSGDLIGYFIVLIHPHLHYKNMTVANSDIFYIKNEYRGTGVSYRMFKYVIDLVERKGADCFYASYKTAHEHEKFFKKLGFFEVERNCLIIFGE